MVLPLRKLLIVGFVVLAAHSPAMAVNPGSLVGMRAPEFALRDMDGNYVSITALRGKIVVLNFWAAWCPPCKVEMPGLDRLRRDYGAKGLEVVAVSTDSSERGTRKYLEENPLGLRVLHDRDGKVSRLYGVYSLPTTFIIDRGGTITRHLSGEQDWDSPAMRKIIEALLERAPRASRPTPKATPVFFHRPTNSL